MTEASELEQAIAVIERAVAQSIPNAQTAAWATIRPALLAALRDAERLRDAPVVTANLWIWESVPEDMEGKLVRLVASSEGE